MNLLNRIFLKAKHWQLFILFFVLPVITGIIFIISRMPLGISDPQEYIDRATGSINTWFYLLLLIISIIEGLWLMCVGLGARKMAPPQTRKKTGFFIFSLIMGFVLPILMIWGLVSFFLNMIATEQAPDIQSNPTLFICIMGAFILLQLFSSFCGLYCVYYTARAWKSAELHRSVSFEDYIVECVFFLFSFIGVWIMQPKINRMANEILKAENEPAN